MVVPRRRRAALPYPFNHSGAHYFYFARNAIYALVLQWRLAGQEILFPSYFHGVELEAALAAGLQPRFYPVRERMRVEVEDIVSRIRPETRGVYLIHYLGFPGPIERLAEECRRRNLLLIEDCALALLSRAGEIPLGSWGDAAVFCLYKTLPVPHGGALVCRRDLPAHFAKQQSPPLASTLPCLASSLYLNLELRGRSWSCAVLRGMRRMRKAVRRAGVGEQIFTGTQHFDVAHARLGMSPLASVVLAAQDYASIVERRRRNYLQLRERLRDVAPPVLEELAPGVCPLFYALQVRHKKTFVERLHGRGVEAVDFWSLSHSALPTGAFPEADRLRATVAELPCHQDLDPEMINWVADQARAVLREVG